jgi:hypothetical protein
MGQSSEVSTTDVTSSAVGARATVASTSEKDETSTAPPAGGENEDLCMAGPRSMPDSQTAEVGGTNIGGDDHKCLFIGTPWENNVIADCRDVDGFKQASRTIGHVLAVMIRVLMLQSLSLIPIILQGLRSNLVYFFL